MFISYFHQCFNFFNVHSTTKKENKFAQSYTRQNNKLFADKAKHTACLSIHTAIQNILPLHRNISSVCIYLVQILKDTLFIDFLGKYVLILSHLAK